MEVISPNSIIAIKRYGWWIAKSSNVRKKWLQKHQKKIGEVILFQIR
jgi:hypothetical protein